MLGLEGGGVHIGLIGCGVVGGALRDWFSKYTSHTLQIWDPFKGYNDRFKYCSAIFISIPIPIEAKGQNLEELARAVKYAKSHSKYVFVRSTLMPGTNDNLNTIACPEFLTQRRAFEDTEKLPILCGTVDDKQFVKQIFPNKDIIFLTNIEAEWAKLSHNLHGLMKVNFWNVVYKFCKLHGADYQKVLDAARITGFIEKEHTQVPGPDGKLGFGGKCFPDNLEAFLRFLAARDHWTEFKMFDAVKQFNKTVREQK